MFPQPSPSAFYQPSSHSFFYAPPQSRSVSSTSSRSSRSSSSSSSEDDGDVLPSSLSSASSASSAGNYNYTTTSPDLSSLAPSSLRPSAPARAPGLPSALSSSSPSLNTSLLPRHHLSATASSADSESEDSAPITPLPGRLPRPKSKLDRERELASGLGGSGGQKKEGLGKKLMRKRADSLKWAKYATQGPVEMELGLSNEELRRA